MIWVASLLRSNTMHLNLLLRSISQSKFKSKPIDTNEYPKYQIMKWIGYNLFTWLHRERGAREGFIKVCRYNWSGRSHCHRKGDSWRMREGDIWIAAIAKQHQRFYVQGSRFKGYNWLILLPILIKMWNTRHYPLSDTDLKPDEGSIPLIPSFRVFSNRNVEPWTAQPKSP